MNKPISYQKGTIISTKEYSSRVKGITIKPEYDIDKCTYSRYVSDSSYGHSGYTGTFFWVDPTHNLIYVFLSNRVYDSRENRQIYELNVRTNIHDLIYENLVEIESDIYF